jgi:hypothetical protein
MSTPSRFLPATLRRRIRNWREHAKQRLTASFYRLHEESPKVLVQDWFKDVQSKNP